MKYNIIFKTDYDCKKLIERLVFECHYKHGIKITQQNNCPLGVLPCPFDDSISCGEITVEDWENVFQEVTE